MRTTKRCPVNECGTCTLCCKLVHVHEIDKPVGKWCPHCSLGKGCQIYEARPTECKTWNCLWLQGAFGNDPDLRPDKCKVVVGYQADFIMVVEDAAPPTIWSSVRGRTPEVRQADGDQAVWPTRRQTGEHDSQRSCCCRRYRLTTLPAANAMHVAPSQPYRANRGRLRRAKRLGFENSLAAISVARRSLQRLFAPPYHVGRTSLARSDLMDMRRFFVHAQSERIG